ncbi:dipeptide ABC transporter ATP-binding protein [Streptomyces sp. BI20]|uniref:dipeptide ABC transporter ATP-binding protein n=1 Tax=Streptomyces sp. BI20 TaxID=3403460 RepID=UPI003C77BE08
MTREHDTGSAPLVRVDDLVVDFPASGVRAVDGLSFTLEAGRALALVGESGSGKSTVAGALLGLHRGTGARVTGSVRVAGVDPAHADPAALRALRGGTAAMVFQDPLSALDPYRSVGDQIAEVYRVHHPAGRRAARARAVAVLDRVGIPDAARAVRRRPHEFSGGQRQRALIAMALACEPRLLVADEPTTALDVTVQARVLDLLHDLRVADGLALLLVTHDVGVAAESVDEVLVMKDGRAVEHGPVEAITRAPARPYTRELIAAVPRLEAPLPLREPAPDPSAPPVVEAVGLRRVFGRGRSALTAVDGVDLVVRPGETLGVVGESGSGKSTLGRMLVGLLPPDAGEVRRDGRRVTGIVPGAQMVFQDPVASLNPRRTVGESVADPLRAAGERDEKTIRARVAELLDLVGLAPEHRDRFPHEFSGGQRQRVGIARALAPRPSLIVCDEPVSALDVTTQAQIVALLERVRRETGIALVFIAHDLAVVRQVSDRVLVMHRGRIVEEGTPDEVYDHPRDPYTRALLAAVPTLDPRQAEPRRAARATAEAAERDRTTGKTPATAGV